jgi:hypothetical protein
MKKHTPTCIIALAALWFGTTAFAATISVNPGGNIQTAINGAASGDTVLLKSGTHRIAAQINLKSNMTLSGESGTKCLSDFEGFVFKINQASNVRVTKIRFEPGTKAGKAGGACIFAGNSSGITVSSCQFYNIGSDCILTYGSGGTVTSCSFNNCSLDGVSIVNSNSTDAPAVSVTGCTASGMNRIAIEIQGKNGGFASVKVDGNTCSSAPNGQHAQISVVDNPNQRTPRTYIRNNTFSNTSICIEVNNKNSLVTGNRMTDANSSASNLGIGIYIANTPNSVYENNTFTRVKDEFKADGGYSGKHWIGNNTIDGVTVSGWAGHPNNPTTRPSL